MGRVTYLHHYVSPRRPHSGPQTDVHSQLPTLWFAVLAAGHVLDTILFSNRRLAPAARWVAFGIAAALVLGVSWWFRAFAFGMEGPVNGYKGLRWRKVSRERMG